MQNRPHSIKKLTRIKRLIHSYDFDLIVSVPDHCLSFYFDISNNDIGTPFKEIGTSYNKTHISYNKILLSYGPRQANLVLIAYASSEGSGEPAHPQTQIRLTGLI